MLSGRVMADSITSVGCKLPWRRVSTTAVAVIFQSGAFPMCDYPLLLVADADRSAASRSTIIRVIIIKSMLEEGA